MPAIPTLKRWRQQDQEFKASPKPRVFKFNLVNLRHSVTPLPKVISYLHLTKDI